MHNGSSLFTGDAGQGESNIRRWIIENDWLEAIVALPLNMFYNTGIGTYVWVLTNRKPEHRRGKVQLSDATGWRRPLRKSLGKKNCELGEEDIARICNTFLAFEESKQSKIFDNAAFGYWQGDGRAPPAHRGRRPQPSLQGCRDQEAEGDRRAAARPHRRSPGRSTSEEQTLIRCAAGSRRPSTAGPPWWQRRYELEPRLPLTAPLVFYQGAEPCPHGRTAKLAGPSDDGLARASRQMRTPLTLGMVEVENQSAFD